MKAEILPPSGDQHCRTGTLCGLEVSITRQAEPSETEGEEEESTEIEGLRTTKLMYEGRTREGVCVCVCPSMSGIYLSTLVCVVCSGGQQQ